MTKWVWILFLASIASSAFAKFDALKASKLVSVVFIGRTEDISPSSFGHLALRFSPQERMGLNDTVVEFVADDIDETGFSRFIKGVGIPGHSMDINVSTNAFINFQQDNIYRQDRDVQILELDLPRNQIIALVNKINDVFEEPHKYGFFKKNCSYYALILLEEIIEKEISNKSFPWKAKDELKKLGLVKNEHFIERGSVKLKNAIQKSNENFGLYNLIDESSPHGFEDMLISNDLSLKASSYFKILSALNSTQDPNEIKNLKRSLLTIKSQETNSHKKFIDEIFLNYQSKDIIDLRSQKLRSNTNVRVTNTEIIFKNQKVFLEVKTMGRKNGRPSNHSLYNDTFTFEIPNMLYHAKNHSLIYKGSKLTTHIKLKDKDFILGNQISVSYSIYNGEIKPYILVDNTPLKKDTKFKISELNDKKILSLNNMTDFKGTMGTCYAMVKIQKALITQAIFLPLEQKDKKLETSSSKIELIKQLLEGKYAVIPGYSDIFHFTSSIDKELFANFVLDYQYSTLSKSGLEAFLENLKNHIELNEENLSYAKALTENGILLPMAIGTFYKNSKRPASVVGHSILVYGIYLDEDKKSHILHAYNPNHGVSIKFKINQDYKIEHPLYSNQYDYRASFIDLNMNEIIQQNYVQSKSPNMKFLKMLSQSEHNQPLSFSDFINYLQ